MLKKENRIKNKKDFDKVFENKKGKFTKNLGLKYTNNNLDIFRVGIIISVKVSKKAVERNRIKRIIRKVFRINLEKLKKGFDVVVITLPEIKEKKQTEIEKDILFLLKKLNLFK